MGAEFRAGGIRPIALWAGHHAAFLFARDRHGCPVARNVPLALRPEGRVVGGLLVGVQEDFDRLIEFPSHLIPDCR